MNADASTYTTEHGAAKCKAKRQYGTLLLALNAGWLFAFKYKVRYSIYPCPYCKHLHLSRQVGRTSALACVL